MNAYDLYKPLRNQLRQIPLIESLGVIRAYLQYMQFRQQLPADIQVDPSFIHAKNPIERRVYEWELELLAKEIILNSPQSAEKTLRQWQSFSGLINKLKEVENNISIRYQDLSKTNILTEMHRIAHRQFQWQLLPNGIWLTRYYKIFRDSDLNRIIDDDKAALFIECKTKKLRYGSKIALAEKATLEEDLNKIADAVVQVYKTIGDWEKGLYPNYPCEHQKKIYPFILTLEEWYIFGDERSDVLIVTLERYIRERLHAEGINESRLTTMPYSICSVADFEVLSQIIAKNGIDHVMSKRFIGDKKFWPFRSFMREQFQSEHASIIELFPDDYKEIHPGLSK